MNTTSLFNHSKQTIDHYNQLDDQVKAVFDRLHSVPLKKTSGYKWDTKMRQTYSTQTIFEDLCPTGNHPYDLRLPWAYNRAKAYNVKQGYKSLFEICPWIDPYFHVPYDYRLGMNNTVITTDEKDRNVVNLKKRFKPSIQHIVPEALGGPTDDIDNMMIMPLRFNELYSDMSPEERFEMIKALTTPSWQERIKLAESKFYTPKSFSIIKT